MTNPWPATTAPLLDGTADAPGSAAAGADHGLLALGGALERTLRRVGRPAPPAGFEPATIRLEGGCSIR